MCTVYTIVADFLISYYCLCVRTECVADKTRYVQAGRVAFLAHGDDKGKLCVVVDIIDQNRALIDGPCSNVNRKQINLKALHLTQFKINIPRSCRAKYVKKAWDAAGITEKWNNTTWAKKLAAQEKRATLTDFDRFKLMKAKQARNRLINVEFGKLRAAWKKTPKKTKQTKGKKVVKKAKK